MNVGDIWHDIFEHRP